MPDQTTRPDPGFLLASESLAEGEFREARVETAHGVRWLVLTRHHGVVRAWLNVCPHAGRALNWAPDKFLTDAAGHLICAVHGATFELERGECVAGPCRGAALSAVDVVERDGAIRLDSTVK